MELYVSCSQFSVLLYFIIECINLFTLSASWSGESGVRAVADVAVPAVDAAAAVHAGMILTFRRQNVTSAFDGT